MKRSLAPVISNREVMPGVYLTWIESPEVASIARPGQFIMVRCGEDTLLRRPLSIHQINETKSRIALLFTIIGRGTRWLSQCQVNDSIDLFGPLGNGFTIRPHSQKLLLVTGGMGIAPLAFLAEAAKRRGCNVRVHQGANEDGQVLLEPLRSHKTLVPSSGVPASATQYAGTIECTASTASVSPVWPTGLAPTYCVQEGYADWADQIFACGPMPMYRAMSQMAEFKGKSQVSLERRMGCGLGACYSCTVKTKGGLKQVCKDGPVFDLQDIHPDELI